MAASRAWLELDVMYIQELTQSFAVKFIVSRNGVRGTVSVDPRGFDDVNHGLCISGIAYHELGVARACISYVHYSAFAVSDYRKEEINLYFHIESLIDVGN